MIEAAKAKINQIDNFYNDIKENKPYDGMMGIPAKHTRHGLGEKTGAYFMLDDMLRGIAFFDDFNRIESKDNFEILEKDGIKVKYTWAIPVSLRYAPKIKLLREKFEII